MLDERDEVKEGSEAGFGGHSPEELARMTDAELDKLVGHELSDDEREILREGAEPPAEAGEEMWKRIEGGLGGGSPK